VAAAWRAADPVCCGKSGGGFAPSSGALVLGHYCRLEAKAGHEERERRPLAPPQPWPPVPWRGPAAITLQAGRAEGASGLPWGFPGPEAGKRGQ
jgi:hypothetical protein